jgi:hypothetical protein
MSNHLPLPFLVILSYFGIHPIRPSANDHWLCGPSPDPMRQVRLSTWLAILAVLVSGLDAKALHHRIYHPTLAPDAQFSLRATLSHAAVADAPSLHSDLATFTKFISQLDTVEKLNGALYQLAYERDSDLSPGDWIISSVKAVSMTFPRLPPTILNFLFESDSATYLPHLLTLSFFIWLVTGKRPL